MKRWYVGLAATMHDPALAIVNPAGEVVWAEAIERSLQCKRAYNSPPDDLFRAPQLIREHCEPGAELVAAVTWSDAHLKSLDAMSEPDVSLDKQIRGKLRDEIMDSNWPIPDPLLTLTVLRNSISQATLNLRSSRQVPNPVIVKRYDHHLTHAAFAAYGSPFEECAVAVVDGYGEKMSSTAFYRFRENRLTRIGGETRTQGELDAGLMSLGLFYGRLCDLCGFDFVSGDEGKVMGLACYGEVDPEIYDLLRPMIRVNGLLTEMGCPPAEIARRIAKLRAKIRPSGASPLESANMARTGQLIFEELLTELFANLYASCESEKLAFAGGCALNSSWNGRILARTPFKALHVPSAPADDGTAVGAALLAYYEDHPESRRSPPAIMSPYLGSFPLREFENVRRFGGLEKLAFAPDDICERTAELLADGKIVGWFQGRAEFGPRALGNRSILADPRPADMKDVINGRVKFREPFRPFAPAILDEHGPEYFESYVTTPYMERALTFRPEVIDKVPAVVHVDRTGRLQSVRREWNSKYYDLIQAFFRLTGIPLVLNTSFNVKGKPIVHSIGDALAMFFSTGLDALVIDDYLLRK